MTSRSLAGWAIRQPVQSKNMWPLKWKSAGKWVRASTPLTRETENSLSKISLSTSQVDSRELSRGNLDGEPKGGRRSGVIPYGDPEIPVSI